MAKLQHAVEIRQQAQGVNCGWAAPAGRAACAKGQEGVLEVVAGQEVVGAESQASVAIVIDGVVVDPEGVCPRERSEINHAAAAGAALDPHLDANAVAWVI